MKLRHLTQIAALAMCCEGAYALTIDLAFTSLPSSQGWTFSTNTGLPESSLYSASGTFLTFNTIGTGGTGVAYYEVPNILDTSSDYALEVTARVTAEEGSPQNALTFFATGLNWFSGISVGKNFYVSTEASAPLIPIDGSIFHNYRMEVQPAGTYKLFVDGVLGLQGNINPLSAPNRITFGDFSAGVNASVEISKLSFQQPIPEPASALLMFVGACGLYVALRRKD